MKIYILAILFFIVSCGEKSDLDFNKNESNEVLEVQSAITTVIAPLGNRKYIASMLKGAFQHSSFFNAGIDSEINWGIISKSSDFSGPCTFNDDDAYCNPYQLNNVYIGMISNSSASRQGYKIQACEKVININDSIFNFLENAKENSTLSSDPLEMAYMVFYPGQNLESGLRSVLLDAFVTATNELGFQSYTITGINLDLSNTTTQFQGWKYLALTLCVSNGWEHL